MAYANPIIGIYSIRNVKSGRTYVGSSGTGIQQRWKSHQHLLRIKKHHSRSLQRSWAKHGEAVFVFEILEVVTDPNAIVSREQHWIDTLHAACPKRGFNMAPSAGSPRGYKHTAATLAKRSAKLKGQTRNFTPEWRAKIAAARRGTTASPETKAKMSAARLGRKHGPMSESHKRNLSLAKKGNASPALKAAVAASNRLRATRARERQMFSSPKEAGV